MSLRGTQRNSRSEIEGQANLSDGGSMESRGSGAETLLDKLLRHSVADPSLPKDYASELDHYLYGLPKRNGPISKSRANGKKKTSAKRRARKRKG